MICLYNYEEFFGDPQNHGQIALRQTNIDHWFIYFHGLAARGEGSQWTIIEALVEHG